jgi:HK97 family phage major capsid protein
MSIQALREQRAAKATAANELAHSKDYNAPAFDALIDEINSLDGQIKRIEQANALVVANAARDASVTAAERHAKDGKSEVSAAFAKWLAYGFDNMSAEEAAVFRNTLSTTTGSQGGFTVPTETATQLIEALRAFGGMREVSTVLITQSGASLSFPTADATTEKGRRVAENAPATATNPAFGTIAVPVYKYSSDSVAAPIELLQDSNIDVEAYVNALLVTRLGRITNEEFTVGTGSSMPRGVVVGAASGLVAANSTSQVTAITYDSLVDLQHSVNRAYRRGGAATFMMNDNTLGRIRKIKDTAGLPIFVPGYNAGVPGGSPDMLLGDRIVINDDMANMAANAKSIIYGDMSKYLIRDAMGVTLRRFDDSGFALNGQVGFCAWLRSGGNLLDSNAVKFFQNAAS